MLFPFLSFSPPKLARQAESPPSRNYWPDFPHPPPWHLGALLFLHLLGLSWGLHCPPRPHPTLSPPLLRAVPLPGQELRSAQACAPHGLQPTRASRRRSLTPQFSPTCKFVIHLALPVSPLPMFLTQYLDQGTDKQVFPLAPYLVSTSVASSAGCSCPSRSFLPWGFGPHNASALAVLSHCKTKRPSLPRASPARTSLCL